MIKVRDFIEQDIEIDVCDDYTEELYIAFCGAMKLTEEGEKKFHEVMEMKVELHDDIAIICVDCDDTDECERRLALACGFFEAAAGYCTTEEYDKWFITNW